MLPDVVMDSHPDIYNVAIVHWKSTRDALSRAIDEFLAASHTLQEILALPSHTPGSYHSLTQMIVSVNSELDSIRLDAEKLARAHLSLSRERNRSEALVPVHRLPQEILSTMMIAACARLTRSDREYDNQRYSSPFTLSSVCSSWRQVALNTPRIWSFIDVIAESQTPRDDTYRLPMLLVERSGNAPLYLSVWDDTNPRIKDIRALNNSELQDLIDFLEPLMPRVCVLDIASYEPPTEIIPDILAMWVENHSPHLRKSLYVQDFYLKNLDAYEVGATPDTPLSEVQFNEFFQSINRLVAQSCSISPTLTGNAGLVDLHLKDIDESYALAQTTLARLLYQCPNLETLVLLDCWVNESETTPNPVPLMKLKSISLEFYDEPDSITHVLPLLGASSNLLDVSLSWANTPQFILDARSFFQRTRILRLYAATNGHDDNGLSPVALLCPLPYLEELVITRFDLHNEEPLTTLSIGMGSDLWPRLHTLYLNNSKTDPGFVSKLVKLAPSLQFLYCYQLFRTCNEEDLSDDELESFQRLMAQGAPHISFQDREPPRRAWVFVCGG
ncbi:F-box-like protein [Ceratobasidium sp. AG-Ba]|nr:F-box-like protein [Ceratobasidium sp. AG-Ba]